MSAVLAERAQEGSERWKGGSGGLWLHGAGPHSGCAPGAQSQES